MSLFSRRKKNAPDSDVETTTDATELADDTGAAEPAGTGPWDVSDVPVLGPRIDLGALRVPARSGMQLRMEVEKNTKQVVAASLSAGGSALQLQAFAAPRTAGLWDELRPEIAASVTAQGGTADEVEGPFGPELLSRLPVRTPEGRSGHRAARFVGVDGPRWFLRGVFTGKAAIDPDAAAELEEIFAGVVVVRGTEARAPRDVLSLEVPGTAGASAEADDDETPDPTKRGPEMTETR
ncbi:DUF3710 domain-containing protein [Georgenia wangjunii]|uniref:DUF3710 domain-containing protein n=1 Tax=Georgenia wangjunii TaxID=3117730 RepID=UPI002F26C396